MMFQDGYLELILGPMFSGKTSRLIKLYDNFIKDGFNVCVVNFSGDTRYHEKYLSTHDKVMIPCTLASKLNEILEEMDASDIILINEGQFFEDLFDVVVELVENRHKQVFICGLDGDFQRKKFGKLLDLIPLCDSVMKLHSKCHKCKGEAPFSHRQIEDKKQVLIGSDIYVPLCRTCYKEKNTVSEKTIF